MTVLIATSYDAGILGGGSFKYGFFNVFDGNGALIGSYPGHVTLDDFGAPIDPRAPVPRAGASASLVTPLVPASTPLFKKNPGRAGYVIKAPEKADLWINPLGGAAAPDGLDCLRIPAGSIARASPGAVELAAFFFFCGVGGLNLTAYEL